MRERYYPYITIFGENFSPKKLVETFGFYIENAYERGDYNSRTKRDHPLGTCNMSVPDAKCGGPETIEYLLNEYERLYNYGLEKMEIEESIFYLIIAERQFRTSIPRKYLKKVCKYFKDFNVAMVDLPPEEYD